MKNLLLICTLLLMIQTPAHAKKKKEEFKFGGRIGVGVDQTNDPADETAGTTPSFEMRLQASSPRKKGFKGVVELRADEGTRQVTINDVFVDYRNKEKTSRVRFGRGKKIIGWEYEYPTAARLSIGRSNAYRFLGERALVGRDYFISYSSIDRVEIKEEPIAVAAEDDEATEAGTDTTDVDEEAKTPRDLQTLVDSSWFDPADLIDPEQRMKYEYSLHFNESKDAAFIASAIYTPTSDFRFGGWLLGERAQAGVRVIGVWQATLSALFQVPHHRAAIELFGGTDSYRTEMETFYGTGKTFTFAAAKAEYGAYVGQWNPYTVGTVLFKDVSSTSNRSLEGILGLRYFIAATLNVAAEGSMISNVARNDPTNVSFSESQLKVMARYFF